LKEFILLYKEQPVWNHKPADSDEEKIVLFSALVQAIELLRNDFLQKFEDIATTSQGKIEVLDFGPLKAIIAQSDQEIKVIERVKISPPPNLLRRTEKFLADIDAMLQLPADASFYDFLSRHEQIQQVYSEAFNPIPLSINVHKRYHVALDYDANLFTKLENKIIEKFQNENGRTLLEEIQVLFEENETADSDIITTIIELTRQNVLQE